MRIKKVYQGTAPENKIVGTYTESDTDAYNCNYINGKMNNLVAKGVFTNKTIAGSSGGGSVVTTFNTITIYKSSYAQNTSNYIKIKKRGKYRVSITTRFGDKDYASHSVSAGISLDRTWLDSEDRNTWTTQYVRASINATYIFDLDVGDTISPQGYTPYADGAFSGVVWVEYLT